MDMRKVLVAGLITTTPIYAYLLAHGMKLTWQILGLVIVTIVAASFSDWWRES